MNLKTVRAAEGRLVRHPVDRQPLAAEGIEVDLDDPFWYRRLRDGDIVEVPAPPAPAKAPAAPKPQAEE